MDFVVSAGHSVKLKGEEKRKICVDLTREPKKTCNRKVTGIAIVIGVLGTVIKELIKGLEDSEIRAQMETSQTTSLLRTARILTSVLET